MKNGGKHSKLRLTGLASANEIEGKLPMFIIEKAKSPRCFKNVNTCPAVIAARRNVGWMAHHVKLIGRLQIVLSVDN